MMMKMEKKQKRKMEKMEMKQRSKRSNISLDELPDGIIELIFSKLSIFILLTCRQVCKSWNNLILSCKFESNLLFFALITPNRNNNLHCIDFDPKHFGETTSIASFSFHPNYSDYCYIKIVNSCNGLFCCSFFDRRDSTTRVCLLNPMTNEYIQLPASSRDSTTKYYYGFGFSPKTKQYKIARHSIHNKISTLVEICVYGTSRRPKWTRVGFNLLAIKTNGAYFNGALYWVAEHRHGYHTKFMYRLDLEDYKLEKFSLVELGMKQGYACNTFLFQVFHGAFYVTLYTRSHEYQVWRMEEDYSSWIKVCVVPKLKLSGSHGDHQDARSYNLQLIKVCDDGKIMCLCAGLDLFLYDPETGTTQILTDQALKIKKHFEVYPIDSFDFNSLHKILAGDG